MTIAATAQFNCEMCYRGVDLSDTHLYHASLPTQVEIHRACMECFDLWKNSTSNTMARECPFCHVTLNEELTATMDSVIRVAGAIINRTQKTPLTINEIFPLAVCTQRIVESQGELTVSLNHAQSEQVRSAVTNALSLLERISEPMNNFGCLLDEELNLSIPIFTQAQLDQTRVALIQLNERAVALNNLLDSRVRDDELSMVYLIELSIIEDATNCLNTTLNVIFNDR